jgi:hypothetical protein
MEFSRHTDARMERLDQIAAMLRDLYPPSREGLPLIIADELEQLEHVSRDPAPRKGN